MAFKYTKKGPPFNFLGHFSETQFSSFKDWVDQRLNNFPEIQIFYQIRAQQLRKTAGLLEQFYAKKNDQQLKPTFEKEAWQPGSDGHFGYTFRNDHVPGAIMAKIKERFQEQLLRDDDGVFFMNHLRNQIERLEDMAQFSSTASADVKQWLGDINQAFGQPEFAAVLVKDQSDMYKGQPRYRVHQLDEPTQWEKEIATHGGPVQLKEKSPG